MKDFREEFRATVGTMMRADVYQAQQATLRAEIASMKTSFESQIAALQRSVEALETEKRQNKGLVFSALGSAAVALFMAFFNLKR
jgi:hypothetical protein